MLPSPTPPLPPRPGASQSSAGRLDRPHPSKTDEQLWTTKDPRSSSMQSLAPSEGGEDRPRRRLLLIYIHGFMGNETSFRSFPAHLHSLLKVFVAGTHVVHTKIYPRYRSKKHIAVARDDFSRWLEPHEDPNTDVVLLGHSMGGLISAEVVLMPAPPPANRPFKHSILGTINFDVPFLGMHPGIVRSGLASIFKPSEDTHEDKYVPDWASTESSDAGTTGSSTVSGAPPRRSDTLWHSEQQDPNFNPSFNNDVILPVRQGWSNVMHFVNKHSQNLGELTKATKRLVSSHLEFGGAMANYGELKVRYARLRTLEEPDDGVRRSVVRDNQTPPRVRFVNYYTACTGRPKTPQSRSPSPASGCPDSLDSFRATSNLQSVSDVALSKTMSGERDKPDGDALAERKTLPSPRISITSDDGGERPLDARALPQESGRQDWDVAAQTLTVGSAEPKEARAQSQPHLDVATSPNGEDAAVRRPASAGSRSSNESPAPMKPPKDRKFCNLPPKDSKGQRDPCWVRVFMADVDEVGAHCGLFFVDERYERLVGDCADRIESWIRAKQG